MKRIGRVLVGVLPLTGCAGEVPSEYDGSSREARAGLAAAEKPAAPAAVTAAAAPGAPVLTKGGPPSPLGALEPPLPWPKGSPDPALDDLDADGVPNADDNCPRMPNPPEGGAQPALCGAGLRQALQERVFLRSRTFVPTGGVDPALYDTAANERVHALLHVDPARGGLSPARRAALKQRGVVVLEPLPRNTFFIAMPRRPALWQELAALPDITGLSALQARDRVAPELRLRGPEGGFPATLDVDFFEDTQAIEQEAVFGRLGVRFERTDDDSYRATIDDFASLERLASEDSVQWLDHTPPGRDRLVNHTQNSWGFVDAWPVNDHLVLDGVGVTVAVAEQAFIPLDHPELFHVIKGNNPVDLGGDDPSHAQQVAAIISGEGDTHPDRVGFLPDASLVSFKATSLLSDKKLYYRFSDEASGYFADLINYSIGIEFNCSKLGRYTKKSKWRDRAVRDFDILSVVAAGNNGDGVSAFDSCLEVPYATLAHDIGKNDLVVGNWDISLATPALEEFSRTGPTEDGRLKPDLVAPGSFVNTIDLDPGGAVVPTQFGGTSAAAPVVTGIAGWVAASLGVDASAAAIKAVLIQTAQDVGAPGPDFKTGYGLIQAAPAVLLARKRTEYVWQGQVPATGGTLTRTFQMQHLSRYKLTLAWTDVAGSANASPALVHDLDLTLEDPAGNIYYPWDLTDHENVQPGTGPDALNNVEQIVVETTDRTPLASGLWTIKVTSGPLTEPQPFAVALTPSCPLTLSEDLTLTADLSCGGDPLISSVIDIVADGVTLNCAGFDIDAAGAAVGVRISANDVKVKNCHIVNAGTGIATEADTRDARLVTNTVEGAQQGIALRGSGHSAKDNTIDDTPANGAGIVVDGDDMRVGTSLKPNFFGGDGIGVDVRPGADGAEIQYNSISSGRIGIRLESSDPDRPIDGCRVYENHFEGPKEPIVVSGNVEMPVIEANEIGFFDPTKTAIRVSPITVETTELAVYNPQILTNSVQGQPSLKQAGIAIEGTTDAVVADNIVQGVGIGISEQSCTTSEVRGNVLSGGPGFIGKTAILSMGSASAIGPLNTATDFTTGISAESSSPQNIVQNSVAAQRFGIVVNTPDVTGSSIISGNSSVQVQSGTGILVSNAPNASISYNTVRRLGAGGNVSGIVVTLSPSVSVSTNQVFVNGTGISVDADEARVANNSVTAATLAGSLPVGIGVSGDECSIDDNTVSNTTGAAIHYLAGYDTNMTNNVLTLSSGTGIRLGSVPLAPCSINVENATITGTTFNLSGAATDLQVLCDVGTYAVVP